MDFPALDEKERRKLFVGLTRAQMMASIVLTKQTEACLAGLVN
jgi:type IV secretory pathway VirB3-like protein